MLGLPQRFRPFFETLPVGLDGGMNLPVTHPADDMFDLQGR